VRCLLLLLGACSFRAAVDGKAPPIDADDREAVEIDAPAAWRTPTVVALPAPTATDDDPSPTDDLLELFINTSRGGNADVYVATRASTSAAWGTPTYVMNISSIANETTPEVGYDGLTMIVASDRTGTVGSSDLWFSSRPNRTAMWSNPAHIDELSSAANEAAGNMTPDGLAIVFSSYRKANLSPDLYIAERATPSAAWNAPVEIAAVNTNGHEGSPFLTADKLTLYFDTDRTGNLDIYVSHRSSTTEAFPAPEPITIDSGFSEQDPWLSADGKRLMFSSDRGGSNQLWEATR
jgi:Tol biopolymer transport system component